MNLKNLSLIGGVIALSLTATSFAMTAEANSSSPLVIAQNKQKGGAFQRLGLTEEQKAKIQEVRSNTRAEMDKILNEQQREQLKTAMQNRRGWRGAVAGLNLTDEQKNQMRQVMQSQKTQMEAILTEQQKEQLQKYRQEMRSRRQQGNM
jgi:periplasmic protein CpxP/Spy